MFSLLVSLVVRFCLFASCLKCVLFLIDSLFVVIACFVDCLYSVCLY